MAILSGDMIRRVVQEKKLVIQPFHDDAIQPASYDLRPGRRVLVSPKGDERGKALDLDQQKEQAIDIHPGQYIAVLTEEMLHLPNDICARFGLKSRFARKGLMSFGGIQVDPGFRGRIAISLFNVGPESIRITRGEPMFTIEFLRLEEPATAPYAGEYQDQEDFPADQYNFILGAHTVSLAEIPDLREQVKELNKRLASVDVLREEIEELLGDPDEGLQLRPEVKERLRQCLATSMNKIDTHTGPEVAKELGLAW